MMISRAWAALSTENAAVGKFHSWGTSLYGVVNKRFLSTGETGELVLENVGFGLNPGVELAPPRSLLSNRRNRPAHKNVQNVADTANGGGHRNCQDNGPGNLVRGRYGSPAWIRTTNNINHF